MAEARFSRSEEVDHLLLNARLRDELEPYFDESITRLNIHDMPTSVENEYLESMLAWERAPVLPIAQWFEPELRIPHPDILDDASLRRALNDVVQKLFEQRIVLDFTEHLSDRQLYCVIYRDILPSPEKKLNSSQRYLHWDCADAGGDPEVWLRYYATDEEREHWEESGEPLPPSEPPPFPRQLPRQPL